MLLLKIIFGLGLVYAIFRIVTWFNHADTHESISIWLSEHFESCDNGDSGSDGSGSSDGGGGGGD